MKRINIFCLPFAGGNKYSYKYYETASPPFLSFTTIEYPGRGSRARESLVSAIDTLVDDLYSQIIERINGSDYALYGHSMGGLAAYLLTRKLIENKKKPPLHLFISGTTGPSARAIQKNKKHLLNKAEFLQEIREYKGISDELLQDNELMDYLEPILRADFTAIENYEYKKDLRLELPFTVMTGEEDDMEMEDVYSWQNETVPDIEFKCFPGSHFFIQLYPKQIVGIISDKLYSHSKI